MSNLELTASMTAKGIQSWAMNNTDGIIEAGVGMVLHKVEGAEHKVTSAEQRASDKQDVKALLREKLVPNGKAILGPVGGPFSLDREYLLVSLSL